MRVARTTGVVVGALLGVAGGTTSVVLASGPGAAVNELAILLVLLAYALVTVIIGVARPGQPVGRLMLYGTCLWGVGEGLLALAVRAVEADRAALAGWLGVLGSLSGLGWLMLVLGLPLIFPDGRTPWGGRRPVVLAGLAIGLFVLASVLAPSPLDYRLPGLESPTGVPEGAAAVVDLLALFALLLAACTLGVAVAGLVHRWRSGDGLLRQQLLWFSTAFAAPLALIPVIWAPFVEPWMFAVVTIPVPVAVAVALLQHHLYDVQLVVNRTVTFVALSTVVAALYAITVGGVGVVLRDRGAPWLPWVAAGTVAVTFAPMRNALQRGVNRLTYGQWSQPGDVLASTGRRLADAADVPGLLRTLTDELGAGLGLAYVEIADVHGRPLAVHGAPQECHDAAPLTAYGEAVGSLRWSPPRLRATGSCSPTWRGRSAASSTRRCGSTTCARPRNGSCSRARRNADGCAVTCTTASVPRSRVSRCRWTRCATSSPAVATRTPSCSGCAAASPRRFSTSAGSSRVCGHPRSTSWGSTVPWRSSRTGSARGRR